MIERLLSGLTLAQTTEVGKGAPSQVSAWAMFLLVICVIVIPFVAGSFLARALRMKDQAMKMGIILFAFVLAVTPFGMRVAQGHSLKDAVRLGIDLAGG